MVRWTRPFAPGVGVNGPVYAVAIQPDKKILLGGQFSSVETVRRIGYARLLPNGWVDTSFLDTSFNQFAGLPNHYYNTAAVNVNDLPPPPVTTRRISSRPWPCNPMAM